MGRVIKIENPLPLKRLRSLMVDSGQVPSQFFIEVFEMIIERMDEIVSGNFPDKEDVDWAEDTLSSDFFYDMLEGDQEVALMYLVETLSEFIMIAEDYRLLGKGLDVLDVTYAKIILKVTDYV